MDAGVWKNQPFAFMPNDFTFFDQSMYQLPTYKTLVTTLQQKRIVFMVIQFRFNKSATKFHKQQYEPIHHKKFDPIDAAVGLILVWDSLVERGRHFYSIMSVISAASYSCGLYIFLTSNKLNLDTESEP